MESQRTKDCKRNVIILSILHLLCLFGPFIYFIPYGFITGGTSSKVALTLGVTLSIILSAIALLVDVSHRAAIHKTIFWVLIAVLILVLNKVKTFVMIMAVISVVDELIICPLRNRAKTALIANKEIDKR